MNKKPGFISILLIITGLLCIGSLFFFGFNTYQRIVSTENDLNGVMDQISQEQQKLKDNADFYINAVDEKQAAQELQKKRANSTTETRERAPGSEDTETTNSSVFSQDNITVNQEDEEDIFSSGEGSVFENSGHVIGIDPGHQGYNVDMSATEPIGPGSSEMKAKASTGTEGSYTGLPEYQLNLDISLKLKTILESRGYQVIMTRTDNDTAISNKERAEYVASQGAEIYVRVHANGEDSHTSSGALTMAPSPDNPYIPELSEESAKLSRCILDSYCQATGFNNLGVQYYDNMTGINWSTVPVTIIEMGFMTNESDDTRMSDAAFQDVMAEGIANGIDVYFEQ